MSLVEQALALPAAEREDFLTASCGQDAELAADVWRRVRSEERMNGFLLTPLLVPSKPRESTFAAGEVLNGRFRIVRVVAQGGMGVVYEAWDQRLDKRVALKCARFDFRGRLPPEVRHATEITHPNVCRVFEIHVAEGRGDVEFLTMEFLEGQTLAERLKQGSLPISEARLIAAQVASGLAEAHRRGIVHGDLKAGNVILTKEQDGRVRAVITDFGLARGTRSAEVITDSGGTPDYMAPELWKGVTPTIASDVYALGVLLFEMMYGRRPGAVAERRERRWWRSPTAGRRWDAAIARCLSTEPGRRYASIDDMLAATAARKLRPSVALLGVGAVLSATFWAAQFARERFWRNDVPSVAVLPFALEGLPPGNEYLAEGLADDLIHTLAQFPRVAVLARTSSFHLANTREGLRKLSQRLGHTFVVSGRVHRVGDHIRVGAELVNPSDDIQIWGTEYDLDGGDLSRVEDIAQQIAEQVGSKLNVGGATTPARHRVKPQAYELLLRGQYQRRLYTPESRQKAVGYFEAALAADPQFALAHAELANTFRLLAGGGILDPADAMPRAEAAAQRALAADDNLAEAHAAMADVLKDRWDWSGAEQEYRRAVALNPSFVDAHMQYAILLSVTGRYPAALLEVQKVRALDPVGLPGAIHAASVYYNGRHYADALAELARARALDPSAPTPHMWMAMTLSASGRFADAVTEYREAISRGDTTGATRAFYAYALAKSGAREQAEEIVRQLVAGGEFVPLTALAVAYAGLDQPDRAVALLSDAYAKPDPSLQYLKVEAHFDSIKDRPDYANLAARLRLP